jgi:membrane fusion protein (multidrug efflux system)
MHTVFRTVTHLLLAAMAAGLVSACSRSEANAPAQPADPEVVVQTIAPRSVTLTAVLPGRTSAHLMSEVRPQVGGIIQKRLFKEGGEVRQGETLYQIDPSTYQAAFESAKAELARAEANALPVRLKAERYANLAKVRAVSTQDNDDAQAAFKQAEAAVVAAKAALQTARINLAYTRVVAPISGRIGKSSVTPGALVTASQATPLAVIQQTNPMFVDVTQSSAEVQRLRRELAEGRIKQSVKGGARVTLLFDDGSEYPVEGSLQFADITVEQSTGSVTLRAEFPNPRGDLLPGLYVRARLEEGVAEQAILVPQQAVQRDAKGNPQVLVVKADGMVEQRDVQVDRVVGQDWLVASGLAAGDRVIVDGLQKVRAGVKVKATEAQAAPADAAQAASAQAAAPAVAAPGKPADAKLADGQAKPAAQAAPAAPGKAPAASEAK